MTVRRIELTQTDSTNTYLRGLPQGDGDMVVVSALHQTAGRGQGSNKWESEPGANLLMSVAVRPLTVPLKCQFVLSMAGALAVAETLDAYTEGISLKWPNDVYWHDSKISGTLIETMVGQGRMQRCIFGIGLNVNQRHFVSDAPNPVSLCQILGYEVPLADVTDAVVHRLAVRLSQVMDGDIEGIIGLYHQRLYRREGLHAYRDDAGPFVAVIDRVEPDGHLVLIDDTGQRRIYAFKEVTFVI